MKKYLPKLIIPILLISFLVPLTVEGFVITIDNPLKANNLQEVIEALINFIFMLALAIAPIMFVIAGFYFITAAGDPAKIEIAKKMILWTFIGLLVVMSAKGLMTLFREIFEVKTP